ncbi:hypothetical protein KFK09_003146 [Dendrobium nobile]|uniref:Uncharacterized protein n=1 Tax=Dendrobium nobile TaxID=94219 RepID=A0A8T3C8V1_DENNO|nr:hypothetical protein KFK09_003146 [Dendrobium nobile]
MFGRLGVLSHAVRLQGWTIFGLISQASWASSCGMLRRAGVRWTRCAEDLCVASVRDQSRESQLYLLLKEAREEGVQLQLAEEEMKIRVFACGVERIRKGESVFFCA